jgi:UPF0755 protein
MMKALRLFGFLFLVSFGTTIFIAQLATGPEETTPMRITVDSGESVRDIAQTLKEQGAIRSVTLFRLYLKSHGLDTGIRPGTFYIEPGMSFADIAKILDEGAGREMPITIPEGFTVAQIDALLAEKGLTEIGAVIDCAKHCDFSTFEFLPQNAGENPGGKLEGYLFPDTYFVNPVDFVPKFFLERMLGNFRTKVVEALAGDIESSGYSLQEEMTMASLIERETRTEEERPIVSGILWKRFDASQGLAVDATIRYALDKPTEALTKIDLQTDSPYNTRKYRGLPPSPIANSGLQSIQAALHPQDSEYWYYLHGNDGQIRYAKTNDEHNANKAKYL